LETTAAIARKIAEVIRGDGGRLQSILIKQLHDFQLAEDSLQDAYEAALVHWKRSGLPGNPQAWLLRAAKRKAIDRLRRIRNFERKQDDFRVLSELQSSDAEIGDVGEIPDERLALIFTCCHPALDQNVSVALTLRTLCGLTTEDIARAYVTPVETMAQRLVRARHKIAKAKIPYSVPDTAQLGERMNAVLDVIYLIFNKGYDAGDAIFSEEAIRLTRLVNSLLPQTAEVEGLLALMTLQQSRRRARIDEQGEIVTLEHQNRQLWDHELIAEGLLLLQTALPRGQLGVFQLQAAISAVHAESESFGTIDWPQIEQLYRLLYRIRPNPIFEINRAVALSYMNGPADALSLLETLEDEVKNYQPFHAAKAHLLERLGRNREALVVYQQAYSISNTDAERSFMSRKIAALVMLS
jgi:RNA polymerase sigma-70 factor, ECF subfamily